MLISAINALTLSPALCGVFLRHRRPPRGTMGRVLSGIDACARRLCRGGAAGCCAWPCWLSRWCWYRCGVGIWLLGRATPTGFLPEEDQGAFFVAVQLPDGASVVAHRGGGAAGRGHAAGRCRRSQGVLSIVGFSLLDGGNQPNAAFMVVRLKPFADRTGAADSAQAVIGRVFGAAQQIRSAMVFPFNLPPIIGLSTSGGFEYQLENLEGRDPAEMAQRDERPAGRRQPGSAPDPRVLHLHRRQRRRSASISTATRRRRWASASPTCSPRCRPRWAASTSTTSTCSAAPGR